MLWREGSKGEQNITKTLFVRYPGEIPQTLFSFLLNGTTIAKIKISIDA